MPIARVFGRYTQTHHFPTTQGPNGRTMQHTVSSSETPREVQWGVNHSPALTKVNIEGHSLTVPQAQTFAGNTTYTYIGLGGRAESRQLTNAKPVAISLQPNSIEIGYYSALPSLPVTLELPYGGYRAPGSANSNLKAVGKATLLADGTAEVEAAFPELYNRYSPLENRVRGTFKVAADGSISNARFTYKNHEFKQT